jgi:hypothetical protein
LETASSNDLLEELMTSVTFAIDMVNPLFTGVRKG